ncbi:hypothetical protein NDU88_007562 [Pleurodeles waltl]|uniref:Uncharacterized protein n=1 Tax=Pleurodeles waltl TaxID=8319 RepID=A0AAV7ST66_PLEWA|nr:hypothetical protein NDU88_007562 [Pleurodeles waltl]
MVDSQTETELRLKLVTIAFEEKKAAVVLGLEEKKLTLVFEAKKTLLVYEMNHEKLDLAAKKISEFIDNDGSDSEVPRRGVGTISEESHCEPQMPIDCNLSKKRLLVRKEPVGVAT